MSNLPTMTPVKSTNIHSVGHDGSALYVRFQGKHTAGKIYRYPTAGVEHHEALLAADSPGRHFLDRIKFFHEGELIGE